MTNQIFDRDDPPAYVDPLDTLDRQLAAANARFARERPEAYRVQLEALERARVVAVLDGWAKAHPGWAWRCTETAGRFCCEGVFIHVNREPLNNERFDCYGPTPDAARAAAARAIEAGEV